MDIQQVDLEVLLSCPVYIYYRSCHWNVNLRNFLISNYRLDENLILSLYGNHIMYPLSTDTCYFCTTSKTISEEKRIT